MRSNIVRFILVGFLLFSTKIFFDLFWSHKNEAEKLSGLSTHCSEQEKKDGVKNVGALDGVAEFFFPKRNLSFSIKNKNDKKYTFCFPRQYFIESIDWNLHPNYELPISSFSTSIYYPEGLPLKYSSDRFGVINVRVRAAERKSIPAYKYESNLLSKYSPAVLSNYNFIKEGYPDIKIGGVIQIIGFMYDKYNRPVIFSRISEGAYNYRVDAVLREDIEFSYSYDKNIKASYFDIHNYVLNFVESHMVP